ncbi:hypothetical protein QFZ73_001146 [Peribacillus sp. V2I11]|nr:hypothetical protein [Peribacillus sp. V2I11]
MGRSCEKGSINDKYLEIWSGKKEQLMTLDPVTMT